MADSGPINFLAIAKSAGGVICINVVDGKVYWFDPNGGAEDPYDDAAPLADSFDEFMHRLISDQN